MELLIVGGLLALLGAFVFGGALWFFAALLVISAAIGWRSYRTRCTSCGKGVIAGRGMRFCNQCGVEQPPGPWRFRCVSCRGLARTEINISFCNHCGNAVTL